MKTSRSLVVLGVAMLVAVATSVVAAPVESVESARATVALQKIDSFLGEQAVANQLKTMGVTKAQIDEKLAQLTDTQVEQLAAQIDLLKAGGMIQSGSPNALGPIGCWFKQLGALLYNVFQTIFCWGELK